MIKNVIFDIGGVIVKFKKETYLDPLGLDEATKNYLIDEILFTDDWFQLSIGKMTDEQFLSNVQKNHPDYFELTKSIFEIETLKQLLPVYSQTIELIKKIKEKGFTLVCTKIYLKNGRAKVEIALAKGKKNFDKRDSEKEKSQKREIERMKG